MLSYQGRTDGASGNAFSKKVNKKWYDTLATICASEELIGTHGQIIEWAYPAPSALPIRFNRGKGRVRKVKISTVSTQRGENFCAYVAADI